MTRWLTEQQAAEYLQVSRSTLWRWAKAGRLPVYRAPGSDKLKRYRQEDLDAMLEPIDPAADADEEGE